MSEVRPRIPRHAFWYGDHDQIKTASGTAYYTQRTGGIDHGHVWIHADNKYFHAEMEPDILLAIIRAAGLDEVWNAAVVLKRVWELPRNCNSNELTDGAALAITSLCQAVEQASEQCPTTRARWTNT